MNPFFLSDNYTLQMHFWKELYLYQYTLGAVMSMCQCFIFHFVLIVGGTVLVFSALCASTLVIVVSGMVVVCMVGRYGGSVYGRMAE